MSPTVVWDYYKTYPECKQAGDDGITAGSWLSYVCALRGGRGWALEVVLGHYATHQSQYNDKVSSTIKCAHFQGDIGHGNGEIPAFPAYVRLAEPASFLEDTCSSGYARLYVPYDTADNPRNIMVIQIGPRTGSITKFFNSDYLNTYKDIYLYICSKYGNHYQCGSHKGPGA